jgi:cell wall assembly regulator SMI1
MSTLSERFMALYPRALSGIGASAEEVADAERKLGVSFPEAFRAYLTDLGYLEFESVEMYGLGVGVPKHLDLVENTIAERTVLHPNIPIQFIPVLNNGCGDHYCLDLRPNALDPPVVFWSHELGPDQTPAFVAERFTGWLLDGTDDSA